MSRLLVITQYDGDSGADQNFLLAIRSFFVKNPRCELGVVAPKNSLGLLSVTNAKTYAKEESTDLESLVEQDGYDRILSFVCELPSAFPKALLSFEKTALEIVELETDMQTKRTFWLGDLNPENRDRTKMAELAKDYANRHRLPFRYFDFAGVPVPEDPNECLKLENILAYDGMLFADGWLSSIFLSLSTFFYGLEEQRESMRKKKGIGDYFFNRGAFRKEEKKFADFFKKKSYSLFDGAKEWTISEKPSSVKEFQRYIELMLPEETPEADDMSKSK